MRISQSTGERPSKSSRTTVAPNRQTVALRSTSRWVNARPSPICQLRMTRYSGDVPTSCCGTQLLLPKTSCMLLPTTTGATSATWGQSRRIASASSGTSEIAAPEPMLTPAVRRPPGRTSAELAPIFSMDLRIDVLEPLPISIIVITAAMPITMPSVVSAARVGLRRSAFRATMTVLKMFMPSLLSARCRR